MKPIKIRTIILYASIVTAVSGLILPTYSNPDNANPNVYAAAKPSDSIPICEDKSLPIHAFCLNMDGQASERLEGLAQWGTEVAKGMLARIDR